MSDLGKRLVAATMEKTLYSEKATDEILNQELLDMIHKLDVVPVPQLEFTVDEYLKIYNWLKELDLYKKLYGPLNRR